jgi:hypothetical protein
MELSKMLIGLCVVMGIGSLSAMAQAPPQPTAEHKVLAADEGTWDATIKSYHGGADSEPSVSKGTEVNTMLAGGLWMVSTFEAEFGGAKFEGRGQFGYNASKGKYVGTWVDSMSHGIAMLEGSYDPKTKTMTYTGEGVDADGKTKYTEKMVTTTKEDGSRVFTLYMKFDKDEVKFMEVTYQKRK